MPSSSPSDSGEFSLIFAEVDAAMIDEAAAKLSEAFHVEPAVAQQVLKCAPIVFARGLTRHEIKSISPRLVELSKFGIELRVTARPTGRLPKLNWPVRPQFTAADSAGPKLAPSFAWEDSAFVCPSCGEAFLFKRVGPLELGATPREEGAEGSDGEAPAGNSAETYTVTIPKVADRAKAEKAAELIARYQGIPVDEALALTSNPTIAVARGVSRSDAQQILEEFKRHRLFGRMSKS
jgi:hypothetical protein